MSFFGIVGLFSVSFFLGLGTIHLARRHDFGADSRPGVQRSHSHWVPRLGGIAIFVSFALWLMLAQWEIPPMDFAGATWVVCLAPPFVIGLAEDLLHKIGAWSRLIVTMTGAVFAWYALDAQIVRLGLPFIDDTLAAAPWLSLAVTALFVGGGAHALNIIDGYNGLASSYAIVVLFAILIVAGYVNDFELLYITLGAITATLGFFVLNFPRGRMFLGDSGAYLLGSLIGYLLAVLVKRHPQVSPMFAAVLLVYPVWELLFSSYRRRVMRGTPAMEPDAIHLHTLVYKRLVRSQLAGSFKQHRVLMNSLTTLYLLVPGAAITTLAVVLWTNTVALSAVFLGAIALYLFVYSALVQFRAQRMAIRPKWKVAKAKADKLK